MRSCRNTLIYGSEPLKSCVFPYGTRWCILAHPRMCIRCTNARVAIQVNNLLIRFCTSSWQSVGIFLLVTKDKWVPPRSCPLPFFPIFPPGNNTLHDKRLLRSFFISTSRLFNKRSFTFLNCLTLVNGNKM